MSTLNAWARTRIPRFADAAVERARLTVVPRRVEAAPRTPFVVLVFVLLAGGVAGLLAFNTQMQQSAFTTTALETRASTLAARQQSLELELEALRDPQHLAAQAKALGMVPAPDPAFVRLSDGKVLGTATAATPDDAMRINPLPPKKPAVLAPRPKVVKVPAKTTDDTTATSRAQRAEARRKKAREERGTQR